MWITLLIPIENCNFASLLFNRKVRQEKIAKAAEKEHALKMKSKISLTIKMNRQINQSF
jgi:hypothetical protein